MRVLFDGFWWSKGPIANRSVMKNIVKAWATEHPYDELMVAVRGRHGIPADMPPEIETVRTLLAPQAISNALELGLLQWRHRADIVVAHNYTPAFGKSVVFVHDLMFEEHPEWFTRRELAYFWPMSALARRARSVVTSSATEAKRIERLHPKVSPVTATGLSISIDLAGALEEKPSALKHVSDFVLAVGRLTARKNLATVIAGAVMSRSVEPGRPLVVVGSDEYSGRAAELPADIRQHVEQGRVLFLGRVSDGELKWMYRNTRGLLFLTLDEGFGLPAAEASYFGAPSILADIAVLREVGGIHSTYVSPASAAEVASAIDALPGRDPEHDPGPILASQAWREVTVRLRETIAPSTAT